jgi:glycosyl transferase family 25
MKILVLNLAEATDRLAHMEREFARLGLSFERLDALRGTDLATRRGAPHPRLTPGTWGCLASHVEACRRIAASGEAWGLVVEDDVWFADGTAAFLRDEERFPADADILKLETYAHEVCIARGVRAEIAGFALRRLLSKHLGTGAYLISARHAARIATVDPITVDVPIDTLLFNPRHLVDRTAVTLQLVPAIAIQEFKLFPAEEVRLASAIDPDRRERKAKRYSGLLGALRGATKGSRDALKRKIRELRQAFALRHEDWERTIVPFGPRAER